METLIEPARTPLDLTFCLLGTRVRVSAWFWIVPGLIGLRIALFLGVWYFFLVAACFFVSVLVHEFGHVLAGRCFGQRSYVVLNGFGGVAIGAAGAFERWQRVVVYAAGPAAQLLFAITLGLASAVILHSWRMDGGIRTLLVATVSYLVPINALLAILNLIPVWPLDGWHIGVEAYQWFRGWNRAAWETDPDWWKRGCDLSEPQWEEGHESGVLKSNWRPLTVLAVLLALAIGWSSLPSTNRETVSDPETATDLFRDFSSDQQSAMARYGGRSITFSAVLRTPPWAPPPDRHGNSGTEAVLYFETSNPGEWLVCLVRSRENLRDLQEGRPYVVSGRVSHYDVSGKLFLLDCLIEADE